MYKLTAILIALISAAVAATVYKKKHEHNKTIAAIDEQAKQKEPPF